MLFAQPYDLSATGFYFNSAEDFDAKVKDLTNAFGDPVEEFEIQFIDGEDIDASLAKAIGINQANFRDFLEIAETWADETKELTIVAVGECGYDFNPSFCPSNYKVEIFAADSIRELAEQFVEEGVFGDIPEPFQGYIDYDAIARDLNVTCFEVTIAGRKLVCESY